LDVIDFNQWEQAYIFSLNEVFKRTKGRAVRSIFFGGGTPSLLLPSIVYNVLSEIDRLWGISDIEISLEANPGTVNLEKLMEFRSAGINRVSIGIQSFLDEGLAILGRSHTLQNSLATIRQVSQLFDNYIAARCGHSSACSPSSRTSFERSCFRSFSRFLKLIYQLLLPYFAGRSKQDRSTNSANQMKNMA
jgi:hypothetical protein